MKSLETVFKYKTYGTRIEAHCGLRIYGHGDETTVVVSELPDNPGRSVTNAWPELATLIVNTFDLNPTTTNFVEHYPQVSRKKDDPETFDRVAFTWKEKTASRPEWRPSSLEKVEEQVGQKVIFENITLPPR